MRDINRGQKKQKEDDDQIHIHFILDENLSMGMAWIAPTFINKKNEERGDNM